MSEKIEVRHKGLTVQILPVKSVKSGVTYTGYRVADYSSGQRKLWTFADLEDAKQKAKDIAEATAAGQKSLLALAPMEREIHAALDAVGPTGVRIDKVAMVFADAIKLVPHDEILLACRAWRDNGFGKQFSPKLVKVAVKEFLIRQEGRISERRWRTNDSYLSAFEKKFGECYVHEITSLEIDDWSRGKKWGRRTRNDVLGTIALFYKHCIERHYVAKSPASSEAIKREKLRGSNVGIFMPEQARKLLNSVDECLRAFLALWSFSGLRKEEAGRISWEQVDAGIQSGAIYLRADQSKTGEARSLPISDNLRAWMMAYRKPTGTVLPAEWQGMQRMDDLANTMARQSKLQWVANGPRHSFGTFHLKLYGDPALTVRLMGTSLDKLQRHYACRSDTVTKQVAIEWFSILPDATADIIPMPILNLESTQAPVVAAS